MPTRRHEKGQTAQQNAARAPTTPLAYRETTEESYGVGASAFDATEQDAMSLVLRGPCPRCGHVMDFEISDLVVRRSAAGRSRHAETAESLEEPMMCTCAFDHPGRPPQYVGCGAYWNIVITSVA